MKSRPITRLLVAAAAAALAFTGSITLPADGAPTGGYDAVGGQVDLPPTIPSLDNFHKGTGTWTLAAGAKVIADAGLDQVAALTAKELTAYLGSDVPIGAATARSSDVSLKVDPSATNLGAEGFTLSLNDKGLTVTGATKQGVFYGTRSVSQLLRQGTLTLPAGSVTSVPKYAERGATVCACQINISTDWIDRMLEQMADLHMNYLLLEMKVKSDNYPQANTWSYYTRDDVKRLVDKADQYGIDVIPEINSPGHMNIWLENLPQYQLADAQGVKDANRLDISNPEARQFYKDIIDEYDGVFSTDYWHMGADEYMIGSSYANYPKLAQYAKEKFGPTAQPADAFTGFINEINAYVKSKGKKLRIWNDGIQDTQQAQLDKDIVVEYWVGSGLTPQQLIQRGYHIMNATDSLYWSRSAMQFKANSAALYNNKNWNAATFTGGRQIDPDSSLLTGAKVSIWPDESYYQTENEVAQEVGDSLRLTAQMTWSASRPYPDWTGFKKAIDAVGTPAAAQRPDPVLSPGTYTVPMLASLSDADWNIVTTHDGYYQLRDTASGKCLVMKTGTKHLGVVTQVGAIPELAACADMSPTWLTGRATAAERNPQKWAITRVGDKYEIINALTQQNLALATGAEKHVDFTLPGAHAPAAGSLVQLPRDMTADNALTTMTKRFSVVASAPSRNVTPKAPQTVTVTVTAPDDAPTGDLTVTPVVPAGWVAAPASVELCAIAPGQSARAMFVVQDTTGVGQADITFRVTGKGVDRSDTLVLSGNPFEPLPVSEIAADSEELSGEPAPNGRVAAAFDSNPNTYWHTQWQGAAPKAPHWVTFKANSEAELAKIGYLPRQGQQNGRIKTYRLYASATAKDGSADWGEPVSSGQFKQVTTMQYVDVPTGVTGPYFKLVAVDMWPSDEGDTGTFTSAAEIAPMARIAPVALVAPDQPEQQCYVAPTPTPTPTPTSTLTPTPSPTVPSTSQNPPQSAQSGGQSSSKSGSALPDKPASSSSSTEGSTMPGSSNGSNKSDQPGHSDQPTGPSKPSQRPGMLPNTGADWGAGFGLLLAVSAAAVVLVTRRRTR